MDLVKKYFAKDRFAKVNGIEITDVSPGYAAARMKLTEDHHNSFGVTHGGALFTLADMAFAAAANTHDVVSLSINVTMSYIKATSTGTLTATAREISSSRKLGIYRVDVQDEEEDIVAIFEGMVYRKKERLEDYI